MVRRGRKTRTAEGLPGLKRELARRGLTQSALARAISYEVGAVYTWASGRCDPQVSAVRAICRVLGCTPDALMLDTAPAAPTAEETL
jgi:transcriptional regulator with XRE-family HTH domain